METTEEKPTMYIITGHKGSGKTTQLAEVLPDHPFLPDVHQENQMMEAVKVAFLTHTDIEKYHGEMRTIHEETTKYLDKQIHNRENIYIEIEASHLTPEYFSDKTNSEYNSHYIYMMCDSEYISADRLSAIPGARPYMDLCTNAQWDARIVYHELNKYALSVPGRLDIYDGSGNKPKLLATINDGKVVIASPKILQKEWLSKDSPLGQRIEKYLGVNQKNLISSKNSIIKNQAETKQVMPNREQKKKMRL